MRRTLIALGGTTFLLFLSACVTVHPIIGPDGTENQLVSGCGSIEVCYAKAREACHGTYKIVNNNSDTHGGKYGVSTSFDLLVKCDQNPSGH